MSDVPAALAQHARLGRRKGVAAVLLASAAALAFGGAAAAQSASSSASQFKYGFGGTGPGTLSQGVDVTTRDANGNKVIVDGVTQIGSDQSIFSHRSVGGAFDSFAGAGGLGAGTAIGNSLNVTVQGNYNTVLVNSTQINNGNINASTVLNGKVNLDGR
jgi:holdfast attachment protein HfaA